MPRRKEKARELPRVKPIVCVVVLPKIDDRMSPGRLVAVAEWRGI